MPQYRAFIKPLNDNASGFITGQELRVVEYKIKRDLLSNATSSITVLKIPEVAEDGDIVGMYDNNGKVVYSGIITSLDTTSATIQCNQMMSIFDFDYLYKYADYTTTSGQSGLEYNIEKIIKKLQTNGGFNQTIFSGFETEVITNTGEYYSHEDSEKTYTTINLTKQFYEAYKTNDIVVDIIPSIKESVLNTIKIGVVANTSDIKQIGDNTNVIRNINITETTASTNVLHIVNKNGTIVASRYLLTDGTITTTDNEVMRPHKQKVKYVETDDTTTGNINKIINEYMPLDNFSHNIDFELVLKNKLINFDDLVLGDYYKLFLNKRFYNSALTGYEMTYKQENGVSVVKLVFGKTRTSLESRLFNNVRS